VKYLACIFLFFSFKASSLEISDFRSGLACTDGKTFGWICHETKKIYITGQGICNWSGEDKPCTWYGFEFNYKNNDPDSFITCESKTSQRVDSGSPQGLIAENVDSEQHSFALEGDSGYSFNPQYTIFTTMEKEQSVIESRTLCKVDGKVVFEFDFKTFFPITK